MLYPFYFYNLLIYQGRFPPCCLKLWVAATSPQHFQTAIT